MKLQSSALVVGVGAIRGLGSAVAHRFAREGHAVTVMGRTEAKLDAVRASIVDAGGICDLLVGDATTENDVAKAFEQACLRGRLRTAVFNAGGNNPRVYADTDPAFFESMWRVGCYAGHLFGLAASRTMLPAGGTVIFTGASASLRGRPRFAAFAAAKAGLRAVAQTMARELGPEGLHVAHVVIDGGIDGERLDTLVPSYKAGKPVDGVLSLDAIAEAYWQLHSQHRSA